MIYIEKNTINTVPLELSGSLASTYVYFLLEFVADFLLEKPSRYFTSPDVAPYPRRVNIFEIEDSSTGSINQAVDNQAINLLAGQYTYKVYASETPIDINDLSTLLATEPVQIGRMLVVGEDTQVNSVYQ